MADKQISQLTEATRVNAGDLFILEQNNSAKKLTGDTLISQLTEALDGHGGISTVLKKSTAGIVDTYEITFTDGTKTLFDITNGNGIASFEKTGERNNVDIYTVTFTSGATQTIEVVNGFQITGIEYVSSRGLVDTYAVAYNDGTRSTFNVTNGRGISSFSEDQIDERTKEYVFSYNDGTSSTFRVKDGEKGDAEFVWIRYSQTEPTRDSQMHVVPSALDAWIGVYKGAENEAPTDYSRYTWYKFKGDKGDTGETPRITSQKVEYAESTSNVVATGVWQETIPIVNQGNFLWTRTTTNWSVGGTIEAYSISRYGIDGSGSVSSVNGVSPDENFNISLSMSNIPDDVGYVTRSQLLRDTSGDRNLLIASDLDSSHEYETTGGQYQTIEDNAITFSSNSGNIESRIYFDVSDYFKERVHAGEQLSYSFDYKFSISNMDEGGFCGFCAIYTYENGDVTKYIYPSLINTDDWTHFVGTDTLNDDSGKLLGARVSLWTSGVSGTYIIKHPKLETGNKSSDWEPAPEDTVLGTRKINGKALDSDVTLAMSDIGGDFTDTQKTNIHNAVESDLSTLDAKIDGKVSDIKINGSAIAKTDGAVEIPVAGSTLGLVKQGTDTGVSIDADGTLRTAIATVDEINIRSSNYAPIVPTNLDYSVKRAMCDNIGAMWTEDEQQAARERIGARDTSPISGQDINLAAGGLPYITLTKGVHYFDSTDTLPDPTLGRIIFVKKA